MHRQQQNMPAPLPGQPVRQAHHGAPMPEPQAVQQPMRLIAKGHRRMRSFSGSFLVMALMGVPAIAVPPLWALVALLWLRLFVLSRLTYYEIWPHVIIIKEGLFPRRLRVSLAPSEISDAWMSQYPLNHLTRDATICIRGRDSDALVKIRRESGILEITGLGNVKEMDRIYAGIQQAVRLARRGYLP